MVHRVEGVRIAKKFAARLGRGRSVSRRLPDDLGGCRFPASLEGGAKFLKRDAHAIDPVLSDFAQHFISRGDVVWDIGANVGFFTFMASGISGPDGEVLAIEADTWLAGNLRRAARQSDGASVRVVPAAITQEFGIAEFVIARSARATNHLASSVGSVMAGGERERQLVPTMSLDYLAGRFRPPDVVKIDVEGAELDVLLGAGDMLSTCQPRLLIEVSEDNASIHELLYALGYRYLDASTRRPVPLPTFNTIALPPTFRSI